MQKQVPYLLSAFGIDEPTENVRANIKKVLPPARNPRSPPSPQGICWAASCLPAPPPKTYAAVPAPGFSCDSFLTRIRGCVRLLKRHRTQLTKRIRGAGVHAARNTSAGAAHCQHACLQGADGARRGTRPVEDPHPHPGAASFLWLSVAPAPSTCLSAVSRPRSDSSMPRVAISGTRCTRTADLCPRGMQKYVYDVSSKPHLGRSNLADTPMNAELLGAPEALKKFLAQDQRS